MMWKAAIATVALTFAGASTLTYAQDGGQPGGERPRGGDRQTGGDRGGRGNFDPAEWQKRMMDRFKEQLKAPDDEWAVIQPKLEKVMTAQRESRAGGMFGGGRRGGPGGGGDQPQDTSALGTASRELRTALENENTSGEEIDKKLAAYRDARAKAEENLAAARKDLKEILSARQEASLVMMGILE
jgi:hypothetical protein